MIARLPLCQNVEARGRHRPRASVTLDYAGRMLRRRRLVADDGTAFVVDLPQARSVHEGEVFVLDDGGTIGIMAAVERLIEITGDLPRLAWHVGNRHAPCEIAEGRLLVRADPVMADMLRTLGAHLRDVDAPFRPEGGAYGRGRTIGHSHLDAHDHHDHDHA